MTANVRRFRKRPVDVEAVRVADQAHDVLQWIRRNGGKGNFRHDGGISIATLEGRMIADPDDWVIRGVKGEFYPRKPDIFEATYDEVES